MATTVDTLLVRIEADMSDLRRTLRRVEQQTEQSQKKLSKSMGRMGGAVKAALGVASIAIISNFGRAIVNLGSQVEEMQAKSSVVFGRFVGDVRAELETFGDSVGRSTHELEGMASSVQDTFVPLGFARGEAAQLSVQLTKLAVDVASFNNAADSETMMAFQSALVGNHEAVRRFGIVITEAELQAELFRMGIQKNSKDVDAQTKVQARLNLIMAGTTDAHGDAARTSDSYANTTKALKAALEELMVNVITPLLPTLAALARGLVNATNKFNEFLEAVGILGGSTGRDAAAIQADLAENTQKTAEATAALAKATQDLKAKSDGLDLKDVMAVLFPKAEQTGATGKALTLGLPTLVANVEKAKAELADLKKRAEELNLELANVLAASAGSDGDDSGGGKKTTDTRDLEKIFKDQEFAVSQLEKAFDGATTAELAAIEALRGVEGATDDHIPQLRELIFQEEQLQKRVDAVTKAHNDAVAAGEKMERNVVNLQKQNEILNLQTLEMTDAERAFAEMRITHGAVVDEFSGKIKTLLEEKFDLQKRIEDSTKKEEEANQKKADAISLIENLTDTETDLEKQQRLLNEAVAEFGEDHLPNVKEALASVEQQMKESDPMFQEFKSALEDVAKGVGDSFADMVVDGKLSLDSFQDIFKNFVKRMISKAIEMFIIEKIFSQVFTGMGFAGGGTVPARAGGGAISGPVLVGERGPELFVPSSAGSIKNNMDTQNILGGAGGPVVNQVINIDAGVSQTVRAEMMTMLPMFKSSAMEAIIDSRRRGGQVATAFGA